MVREDVVEGTGLELKEGMMPLAVAQSKVMREPETPSHTFMREYC